MTKRRVERHVVRHVERYVLGVDGGSSKTVALVASLDGCVVGAGRGGPGDIYEGEAAAFGAVRTAVGAALGEAGLDRPPTHSVFGMSGADWPEDFGLIRATLHADGLTPLRVVNDAVGALYAGLPNGPGVVVACGTGAATGARGVKGELWHSSFWQEAQGGFELSVKTLRAVFRAQLGIGPPTALTESVLAVLGVPDVEAALHLTTARARPHPSRWSGLTRTLLSEADEGDAVARGIVTAHARALGDTALAAARQVGIEAQPFSLVLTGGVFRHPSALLTDALVARVQEDTPTVRILRSQLEPVFGALIIALQAVGVATDEAVLANLKSSSPPEGFFST